MSATTSPDQSSAPGEASAPTPAGALAAAHAEARGRAEVGDLTGARALLEDALTAGDLQLGRDHPALAPLMVDLATIARNLGNLTEAQAQLRRAYAIIVLAGGPEHATSLSIEGRLAAVTHRLGEPTEAYDWHLSDVGSRVLGPEHPAVRGAQHRLASEPADARPEPAEPEESVTPSGRVPVPPPAPFADEPDFAPAYAPSPQAPGVYQRLRQPDDIYVIEEPSQRYRYADEDREPEPRPRPRRRGNRGGLALVASLGAAVFIAAAIVAVQFVAPTGDRASVTPSTAAPSVVPTAPPPIGVALKDDGGSVTLSWVDPSIGNVPFIVAGGRINTPSTPLETVPAGRTTATIYGLNNRYDYCFTVAAVWSSDMIVPSMRACTRRLSTAGAS